MIRRLLALAALLSLQGCTDVLFLHPDSFPHYDPGTGGAKYEVVHFPSEDGTLLAGIFFPSATRPALGTVVHFHGNAENATAHFPFSSWLAKDGFNVLVFDYRGFGGSRGRRDIDGAVQDGIAALKYAASRPDVDPDKILVFGQSIGTAFAVVAAAESGLPGIKAVVLEGSFYSYRSIARAKLAAHWLTWPLQTLLPPLLLTSKDSPADYIRRLPRCPVLFVSAAGDPVVPYAEGLKLYAAAPEPKELWTAPGGHLAAFAAFRGYYGPKLVEFFKKALGPRSSNKL